MNISKKQTSQNYLEKLIEVPSHESLEKIEIEINIISRIINNAIDHLVDPLFNYKKIKLRIKEAIFLEKEILKEYQNAALKIKKILDKEEKK